MIKFEDASIDDRCSLSNNRSKSLKILFSLIRSNRGNHFREKKFYRVTEKDDDKVKSQLRLKFQKKSL